MLLTVLTAITYAPAVEEKKVVIQAYGSSL
jgi:hypothetical protein